MPFVLTAHYVPLLVSPGVLNAYRKRLTNLSHRNRSLLLSQLPTGQFLDLHELDYLLNRPSFDVVAQLLAGNANVVLSTVADSRDERSNRVSKNLRRLARTEQFVADERGAEDLYVGWPFVRGKFLDGTVVHGPLLFFPVHLVQQRNQWQLERRGDVRALVNQTMLLAYAHFSQVAVADSWLDEDFGQFSADALTFRTQLYEWLNRSPLEINFNQALFADVLHSFDRQTARQLDASERSGELKLQPEAVLGIFPQAGSYLVPDYDALLAIDPEALPERSAPTPGFSLRETRLHTPLPIDRPQEAALRAVKAGQSVVVQGPPGTGKSQLIANLLADAAAAGQRALLVCQKRAALDVVYERLRAVGMAPFTALIHDFQNDRRLLYAQLAEQIDQVEPYRRQNHSLDAVLLEREFDAECRRIDGLTADLQAFKDALFDAAVCGLSAKELYLTSSPDAPALDLGELYDRFSFGTVADFERRLADYAAYRQRLSAVHPWAERVSFARFSAGDVQKIHQTIHHVVETAERLAEQAETWFAKLPGDASPGVPVTTPAPTTFLALVRRGDARRGDARQPDELLRVADALAEPFVWPVLTRWLTERSGPADAQRFAALRTDMDELRRQGLIERALAAHELLPFGQRLQAAVEARRTPWRWWFYADKPFVRDVAAENGLATRLPDLYKLTERFARRLSWDQLAETAGTLFTDANVVASSPQQTAATLDQLQTAINRADALNQTLQNRFAPLRAWLAGQPDADTARRELRHLHHWLQTLTDAHRAWQPYLTNRQIAQLLATGAPAAEPLVTSLRSDADLLIEADRLFEGFTALERHVVDRLAPYPPANWPALFDNGLRLAWLDALERRYPMLRHVSSLRMAQDEQALQASLRQKQAISRDMLLVKLRERTYRHLTLNRLGNVVTYRELRHQVVKKRHIWPVRKLLGQFADDVFRLVPCWLASPESVSALFPLQAGLFDLVIFDEASQCFAENGIPAAFRGQQVVITGDSQQLRPTDLYRIRYETPDDAPDMALEVESLLELAAQSLPQLTLTGHYRSRRPELIQFSNDRFYRNRLTLLPDFRDMQPAETEPPIRYVRVAGTWQAQTNPTEAQTVLTLLDALRQERSDWSVGVVTFNFQQQQLIQERLDERPTAEFRRLFVKNIENVQGDECDALIFSVGYAPDERGRLTMQFGSLNAAGGENRLNVAVTRARERIYVVTSLWPEQLTVDNVVNEGPKLLKAYLHYARNVSEGRFRPQPRPAEGWRATTLLKHRLAAQQATLRAELPFADLTELTDAGQYAGLVLTDDDQYHAQPVKEAHAYLPVALAERNWPYRRVWSRNFWQQQAATT